MKALLTGGAGFIGSALARALVREPEIETLDVDKLSYAGNLSSLKELEGNPRHRLLRADICDREAMARAFAEFQPDCVLHLAAESHVDRSLDGPLDFVQTNIVGSAVLLDCALRYWRGLPEGRRESFRFIQASTDEVYGSLGPEGSFSETSPYAPRSPYSASKAAADHLARAWRQSYGLPVIVTNCSNNYGPRQFPEKLIPLFILNALKGLPLPLYGSGEDVRDWIHVDDHVKALLLILRKGRPGESYNIGASCERSNLELARSLCSLLDEMAPERRKKGLGSYAELLSFVADRPGHDRRYALDASKIRSELGWRPETGFEDGLRSSVRWYLDNAWWWEPLRKGKYAGGRLGMPPPSGASL